MQREVKEQNKRCLHAEKQVRIVLAINRDKAVLPFQSCDTARKTILHIPENTSSKIN